MSRSQRTAVVAVGGNSLIVSKDKTSLSDQFRAASTTVKHLTAMIEAGWKVVITHGSGPQVGFILRRSEIALGEVPPVPMDYAGADIQGSVGWMFQRALHNELQRRGFDVRVIALVTQVLVDRNDPAFREPTKPIGTLMDEATAKRLAEQNGWTVKADSAHGWRRVVPSPQPQAIVELETIRLLLEAGHVVIACGGGGIPVFEDEAGNYQGIEAVVDKDLTSSLLAQSLRADLFLVSTGVERVALEFNTPRQRWVDRMTLAEVRVAIAQGQFDKGSMGPKIQAILAYLENGGTQALITDPAHIEQALAGLAGTSFIPEWESPRA
ncbi:MAG: carbamate kinase [SAR324 cluster bacterium]|nr:carbamate kinase [SAR324 cluster bacterium]